MNNRDYPEHFDYEEGRECAFCGNAIEDHKEFCSRECYLADNDENC